MLKAGNTSGTIVLQHSASRDPSSFVPLSGTSTVLTAVSNTPVEVTSFLRYVRWSASNVVGEPVVLIDLVAKE